MTKIDIPQGYYLETISANNCPMNIMIQVLKRIANTSENTFPLPIMSQTITGGDMDR
jgi:hypothetical protein